VASEAGIGDKLINFLINQVDIVLKIRLTIKTLIPSSEIPEPLLTYHLKTELSTIVFRYKLDT
jgi:hypothetical protein